MNDELSLCPDCGHPMSEHEEEMTDDEFCDRVMDIQHQILNITTEEPNGRVCQIGLEEALSVFFYEWVKCNDALVFDDEVEEMFRRIRGSLEHLKTDKYWAKTN
jgi:hypothetical protein